MNIKTIHTNHFSLMAGNGHIRVACGEQLRQDIQPMPDYVMLIPWDAAEALAEKITETIMRARDDKTPGFEKQNKTTPRIVS